MMRYHLDILDEIETVVAKHQLTLLQQDLHREIVAASTGGELVSSTGALLLNYRKESSYVPEDLKRLITELEEYCLFNGIRFNI